AHDGKVVEAAPQRSARRVIVLDGEPGDPTVELRHLKQPAEPVGPLTLRHDHSAGRTGLFDGRPDLLQYLIATGPNGITAEEAALAIIGRATDNDRRRSGGSSRGSSPAAWQKSRRESGEVTD